MKLMDLSNSTQAQEINYTLPVEGSRVKRNQVTGMHLMAGLLLVVMGLLTWAVPNQVKQAEFAFLNQAGIAYAIFGVLLLIITIFFNKKIVQTKAGLVLRIIEILALLPIFIYALQNKWYLPATYSGATLAGILFAYFWEKSGTKPRYIFIDKNGINLQQFAGSKKIAWPDVTRVLLRHHILTIDCRDNRLMQYKVLPEQLSIEKESFEQNCAQLIRDHEHLHQKDW
ncbi:hypothetical protein [Taibaiella chishuiensis]|uniref:Uncharacterized protein n=1 Tax=Taibaiella chishuiensis TaxID=1434707 RepID=A0A2P8DAX1_9BACT|nr:hypothetical protein [Taibaiella chishuiensis]PSK94368.1 hypothetical protein B0I18_101523 [Taibaiella chishuiensis]